MTTAKSSTPQQVKKSFDDLFASFSQEELTDQQARLLAFRFLSEIDKTMEETGTSKKQLAEKVGTSASYITQLFRGDRLPNFTILAKIQDALGIHFAVTSNSAELPVSQKQFDFPKIETHSLKYFSSFTKPQCESKPEVKRAKT